MNRPISQPVPVSAEKLFPGKTFLRIKEVAEVLDVDIGQVLNLIELGDLKAMDVSSPPRKAGQTEGMRDESGKPVLVGNRTSRRCWRIAVADLDQFISRRAGNSRTNPPISQPVPVSAEKLFPGKTFLRAKEVAEVLDVDSSQVLKLIKLGALEAMDVSSRDESGKPVPVGKESSPRCWRIAAADLDQFISRRVYGG